MVRGIRQGTTGRRALSLAFCIATGALSAQQPTLKITSPENGALVYSGADLAVTVEAAPENAFRYVTIFAPFKVGQLLTSPPYRFSVSIPARTSPGRYSLTAVGVIRPGLGVDSPNVDIQVEHPGTPLRVKGEPPLMVFQSVGEERQLHAAAVFADAALFVEDSREVKFSSDDTGIVTVDSQGMAKAIAPGEANITIGYQGKSAVAHIKVMAPRRQNTSEGK